MIRLYLIYSNTFDNSDTHYNNSLVQMQYHSVVDHTSFCGVNSEALVPEATHQDVAVIRRHHEAVCVDLDTLIHEVCDLPLVYSRVVGYRKTTTKASPSQVTDHT